MLTVGEEHIVACYSGECLADDCVLDTVSQSASSAREMMKKRSILVELISQRNEQRKQASASASIREVEKTFSLSAVCKRQPCNENAAGKNASRSTIPSIYISVSPFQQSVYFLCGC